MSLKPVNWLGDSLESVRGFPDDPRREAGYQLERVQAEKDPADWKPMPSVGLGVKEIRVREGGAYRVMHCPVCRSDIRASRLPEEGEQDAKARY